MNSLSILLVSLVCFYVSVWTTTLKKTAKGQRVRKASAQDRECSKTVQSQTLLFCLFYL